MKPNRRTTKGRTTKGITTKRRTTKSHKRINKTKKGGCNCNKPTIKII